MVDPRHIQQSRPNAGGAGRMFEAEIVASIEMQLGWHYGKLPDESGPRANGRYGGHQRPCDLCVPVGAGRTLWIECKSTAQYRFPLSQIASHQLVAARQLTQMGHLWWLLVNYRIPIRKSGDVAVNETFALTAETLGDWIAEPGASIPLEGARRDGLALPHVFLRPGAWGWDIRGLVPGVAIAEEDSQ